MNNPTPTPAKPDFFTSDKCTIFITSDFNAWLYGTTFERICKNTPRVLLFEFGKFIEIRKNMRSITLPVDGLNGEKGIFSRVVTGHFSTWDISVLTDFLKAEIEKYYTFNYSPTTTQAPC